MDQFKTRRALRDVSPRMAEAWTTLDARKRSRPANLIAALFLVGHCHIGAYFVLLDLDDWLLYPWHGDDFNRKCFFNIEGYLKEGSFLLR